MTGHSDLVWKRPGSWWFAPDEGDLTDNRLLKRSLKRHPVATTLLNLKVHRKPREARTWAAVAGAGLGRTGRRYTDSAPPFCT